MITEESLQSSIIDLATMLGFLIHHDRPAMSSSGNWATHVQGHTGFPDLILVHERSHAIVVMELKGKDAPTPTKNQWRWLDAFKRPDPSVSGMWTCVFRPEHWQAGDVERVLQAAAGWGRSDTAMDDTINSDAI
jgi:hypothetical protein